MAMSDGSEQGYGMVDRGAPTDIKIGAVPTTTGGGGGGTGASATMDVDRLWGHRESADQRFGEIVGMERYALCEQNYLLVDKQRVHAWDKNGTPLLRRHETINPRDTGSTPNGVRPDNLGERYHDGDARADDGHPCRGGWFCERIEPLRHLLHDCGCYAC